MKGTPNEAQIDKLRGGILLEGYRTAPAKITPKAPGRPTGPRRRGEPEGDNSWWTVEISEGRTRQIREMFHRIGHPVQKLRRVAIGPLRDARLPLGALRELTEQEVQKLLRSAAQEKKPAVAPAKTAAKKAPAKKAADKPAPRPAAPRKPATKKTASGKPAPRAPRKPDARKASARPAAKKASTPSRKPPTGVKRAGARKPKPRQGR